MRFGKRYCFAAAVIAFATGTSVPACNLGARINHPASAIAISPQPLMDADHLPPHEATAIGLWQSQFTGEDGSMFVGFESFYADGNELLIDNSAPATDNVCSGVWERTGERTYKINHPSWDFDASGNLIGIVVLLETVTVDYRGNKFKGTESVVVYDPTMTTITYQTKGTVTGTRITAQSSPL